MDQLARSKTHARMAHIAVCIMCLVWTGIVGNTISLFADPMINELGITRAQFMISIATLVAATNGCMSFFVFGKLQEKLGIRKMMLLGGIIGTLAFVLYATAKNVLMLYAAGVLFGAGLSMLFSNTLAVVINQWYKKNVGTNMSIAQTIGSIGGIVFTTIYSFMIAAIGWRPAMWVNVAIAAASAVIMVLLYRGAPEDLGDVPMFAGEEEEKEEVVEEDGVDFKTSLRSPKFYVLALIVVMFGVLGYSPFANLALITTDLGYGTLAGTFLSVALLASAVSLIPCGRIIDKFGTKIMVSICMVFLVIVLAIFKMQIASLPVLYLCSVLLGITYNVCILPGNLTVKELLGTKDYAKKVGVTGAAALVGMSVGPTVMAALCDATGSYDLAYIVFAVAAIIVAVLIFPMTKRVEEKKSGSLNPDPSPVKD